MQTGSSSNNSMEVQETGGNTGPGGEDVSGTNGWKNKKIINKKNPSLEKNKAKDAKPTFQKAGQAKKAGELETLAVMFVDQTMGGALQKSLQMAEDKVAEMVGYRIRMVESSGTQLCRLLPCTNPWKGQHCGRASCYTCEQGGEVLQNCRQRNVLYESMCMVCNQEEEGRKTTNQKDKLQMLKEQTGVYVGETSRSIFEKAGEHRRDAVAGQEDSNMMKHWKLSHPELQ